MPHKDPATKKKYFQEYYRKNKEKLREYRDRYRKANPHLEAGWQATYREGSAESRRDAAVYQRYGVTPEQFQQMFEKQERACACCKKPFTKTPHIDHCHSSGVVRGLLCSPCNTGLGVYEKKQHLFKDYLEGCLSGSVTEDSE